jgi:hypothetical protein
MTQKDAVFTAVMHVLEDAGINFVVGTDDAAAVLNRELRAAINTRLVHDFLNGAIELSDEAKAKRGDNSKLKAYVSGLVSNWVRKDNRLNGGRTPSSTKTETDPQLKALKKLQSSQTDVSKRLEIQSFIDKRHEELNA